MPGRGGQDRREAPTDRHARALGDKGDRFEVALDHLAEIDVNEIAILVDHRVDGVDLAQHAHDLELLLVQRVAREVALDRRRVLHEARAVKGADGVGVGDSRCDDLPAARVAGHEMRLDEPGGDPQLGLDEAAIELDRRAPSGGHTQVDVRRVVARVVILDAHRLLHPGVAEDFGELRALVRPMQAGRNQHGDAFARHAGLEHALDQRAQEQVIRDRSRDVADQDARALPSAGERAVRRRSDRARERVAHRRPGIGQLRHRSLADHGRPRARRQPDLHPGLAVEDVDSFRRRSFVHRCLLPLTRGPCPRAAPVGAVTVSFPAGRDQFTAPRPANAHAGGTQEVRRSGARSRRQATPRPGVSLWHRRR